MLHQEAGQSINNHYWSYLDYDRGWGASSAVTAGTLHCIVLVWKYNPVGTKTDEHDNLSTLMTIPFSLVLSAAPSYIAVMWLQRLSNLDVRRFFPETWLKTAPIKRWVYHLNKYIFLFGKIYFMRYFILNTYLHNIWDNKYNNIFQINLL